MDSFCILGLPYHAVQNATEVTENKSHQVVAKSTTTSNHPKTSTVYDAGPILSQHKYPTSRKCEANSVLMMVHHVQRWSNIKIVGSS